MRQARVLVAAVLCARVAGAQDTREVLLRLHRAGDTVSIRGATVTIDHTIEAGNTDSAGIVRIPDLLDGGHIVEVVARGYQAYFDNFVSGASIKQPIQLELLPVPASDTARAKGQKTDLTFVGFSARRTKGQGKFFTRAQLDKASGRPLANLLKTDASAFFVPGPRGESQACHAVVTDNGALLRAGGPRRRSNLSVRKRQSARPRQDLRRSTRRDRVLRAAATVPPELRDAATCGALVLWSR
jgi:hypothetical protein